MSHWQIERTAKPKPLRGEYDDERKRKKREHKARETETMRWVREVRDRKCRVPRCKFKHLRLECCHVKHRGMGGNPTEDRTVTALLFAACLRHHRLYDLGLIDAEPEDVTLGFNGPAAWFTVNPETGRRECIGVEQRIGESETRGV